MNPLVHSVLYMAGYGLAAALILSLALGILIKVWNWLTPIDEWEELRKGNIAVAIVMAAVIVGFAIVVSVAIAPTNTPEISPTAPQAATLP
jgi:uncharacterized membrane protein YjfL (UPF0719 family)